MKTTALAGALLTLTVALSPARPFGNDYAEDDADQISRTVVHKDGTYTTTQRDSDASTLVRETKHRNGTLVMRSEFAIDEFGRERKGRVYDGQNNLLFISEFVWDGRGKPQEERIYNSQGRLVRRLIYQHDRFGKSKPFCATYSDGRPIGELVELDDRADLSTTSSHAHSGGSGAMVRSSDGSSVRLSGDAVQYSGIRGATAPSSRASSSRSSSRSKTSKPRRSRPRIFNPRK
jgi:hypothetical protein